MKPCLCKECEHCGAEDIQITDGMRTCFSCGVSEAFVGSDYQEKMSAYEKQQVYRNHVVTDASQYEERVYLKQLLRSIEATEPRRVPDEVIEVVRQYFERRRWTCPEDITVIRIRKCLQELNHLLNYKHLQINKYYSNANQIRSRLCGNDYIIRMDPLVKDLFISFFLKILRVWVNKVRPGNRHNFMHYPSVVRRECDLFANKEFAQKHNITKRDRQMFIDIASQLPRLKGNRYEPEQNRLWEQCMKELDLPVISPVPEGVEYELQDDSESEEGELDPSLVD